ncbi:GNAT family N-acetyltransferase [Rhizorhapis sp. SPR117]|uniref:GNAT family N-acetyltransferase n=1 Tax=Rhizorhapis sp. SPR117 TaxID=2912611 RepID=UPI001F3ECB2E|nr:GNAT family N-acetyltransferase [Rhizorhapis sp. SPR117]
MDMTPDPALHSAAKLRPAWEALVANAAEANCFYMPAMLLPALRHLADQDDVRLIEAWRDDTLIGLLPVAIASRHGRYPIANVTNWTHRHCFFGAPIIRKGQEIHAWEHFLSALDGADWAPHFLHLTGLDSDGANVAALQEVCARQRRGLRSIHGYARAFLKSRLSADEYWETHIRGKKRKEIRRLQKRLKELGTMTSSTLTHVDDISAWCDAFLALELAGWKGVEGTAMACNPADAAFFRDCIASAFADGTVDFLRLDFDGKPIAMLVNFLMGEGAFSFKIAFDETMARFSPGVLIEIDNLRHVLDSGGADWMDSCAAPGHPMIDSLWAERRHIVQYRVALRGIRRSIAWHALQIVDNITARLRALNGKK